MPLPRGIARFNKSVTNRLFAPLAGRVPPWVIVEHRGRRSGRTYRTVVWAFPHGKDLVFALTYGPDSDWVRNVLAAQACRVKWLSRWRTFSQIELLQGKAGLSLLPRFLQLTLPRAGMTYVIRMASV